jgi:hypothetical protein
MNDKQKIETSFFTLKFQVLGAAAEEAPTWETGLVELLYCDRKDAAKLFHSGTNAKHLQGRPSTTKGLWSCIMIFRA